MFVGVALDKSSLLSKESYRGSRAAAALRRQLGYDIGGLLKDLRGVPVAARNIRADIAKRVNRLFRGKRARDAYKRDKELYQKGEVKTRPEPLLSMIANPDVMRESREVGAAYTQDKSLARALAASRGVSFKPATAEEMRAASTVMDRAVQGRPAKAKAGGGGSGGSTDDFRRWYDKWKKDFNERYKDGYGTRDSDGFYTHNPDAEGFSGSNGYALANKILVSSAIGLGSALLARDLYKAFAGNSSKNKPKKVKVEKFKNKQDTVEFSPGESKAAGELDLSKRAVSKRDARDAAMAAGGAGAIGAGVIGAAQLHGAAESAKRTDEALKELRKGFEDSGRRFTSKEAEKWVEYGRRYAEGLEDLTKNRSLLGMRPPLEPWVVDETFNFASPEARKLNLRERLLAYLDAIKGTPGRSTRGTPAGDAYAKAAPMAHAHIAPFFEEGMSAHSPVSAELLMGYPSPELDDKLGRSMAKLLESAKESSLGERAVLNLFAKTNESTAKRYEPVINFMRKVELDSAKGLASPADVKMANRLGVMMSAMHHGASGFKLADVYASNVGRAAEILPKLSLAGKLAGIGMVGGGAYMAYPSLRRLYKRMGKESAEASDYAAGAAAVPSALLAKLLVENPSIRRFSPDLDDYRALVLSAGPDEMATRNLSSMGVQAQGLARDLGLRGISATQESGQKIKGLADMFLRPGAYDAAVMVGSSPASIPQMLPEFMTAGLPLTSHGMATGRLFTDAGAGSVGANQPFLAWNYAPNGMRVADPSGYDVTMIPGYDPGDAVPVELKGAKSGVGIGSIINEPEPFQSTPYQPKGAKGKVIITSGGGSGIPLLLTDTTDSMNPLFVKFDAERRGLLDDILEASRNKYGADVDVVWHTGLPVDKRGKFVGDTVWGRASADYLNDVNALKEAGDARFSNLTLSPRLGRDAVARDFASAHHIVGLGGSTLAEMAKMPGEHLPHGITIVEPDMRIRGMSGHWRHNYERYKDKAFPHMDMVSMSQMGRGDAIKNAFAKAAPVVAEGRLPYQSDLSAAASALKDAIRAKRAANLSRLKMLGAATLAGGGLWGWLKHRENEKKLARRLALSKEV